MSRYSDLTHKIANACIPLPSDCNGNPRYFIPANLLPVALGSPLAKANGLKTYRGKAYGSGFVYQTYCLVGSIADVLLDLDEDRPFSVAHVLKNQTETVDSPMNSFLVKVSLPERGLNHCKETCLRFAPSLIGSVDPFTINLPFDADSELLGYGILDITMNISAGYQIVRALEGVDRTLYDGLIVKFSECQDQTDDMAKVLFPCDSTPVVHRFVLGYFE
jgi:hypothetical protein